MFRLAPGLAKAASAESGTLLAPCTPNEHNVKNKKRYVLAPERRG